MKRGDHDHPKSLDELVGIHCTDHDDMIELAEKRGVDPSLCAYVFLTWRDAGFGWYLIAPGDWLICRGVGWGGTPYIRQVLTDAEFRKEWSETPLVDGALFAKMAAFCAWASDHGVIETAMDDHIGSYLETNTDEEYQDILNGIEKEISNMPTLPELVEEKCPRCKTSTRRLFLKPADIDKLSWMDCELPPSPDSRPVCEDCRSRIIDEVRKTLKYGGKSR